MSWYKTGTVAINNGSTTVTGSGTAWVDNVDVGEGILLPDGRTYEIVGVASNTSLTIGRAYLGSNSSGGAYEIQPFRGRIAGLTARASELLDSFQAVRDGIGAGLMAGGTVTSPGLRFSSDQDTGFYSLGSNQFGVATGGQPSAFFNSDGSLFVRPRASGSRSKAMEIGRWADGGGNVYGLDVQDSDGTSAAWMKAGRFGGDFFWAHESGTGEILAVRFGLRTNDHFIDLYGPNSDNTLKTRISGTGNSFFGTPVLPQSDNSVPLGSAASRWSIIYAASGSINTSDEREKTWRGALDATELRAAKRIIAELGIYQWNDAIAEKGANKARLHFGIRAQRVFAILGDEGLDWSRYAWCCYDEWDENPLSAAGNRYGIRPDQLTLWLIAAQAEIQADLEARIAALEAA